VPSLLGRVGVKRFSDFSIDSVLISVAGPRFSSGSALRPSHDGIRRLGWNDLLNVLAVRQTAGTRHKTDSPQPSSLRRTSLHRSAELWFLLSSFGPLMRLGGRPCPPELGTVRPYAVHDNRHSPRHGDNRPLHSRWRAIFVPQALSHDHLMVRVSMTWPHRTAWCGPSRPRISKCCPSGRSRLTGAGVASSEHGTDCLGVLETGRNVDRRPEG